MAHGFYKIKNFATNKGRKYYQIAVPRQMAESLPSDMVYCPEITEDGILYRPKKLETKKETLPTWAGDPS